MPYYTKDRLSKTWNQVNNNNNHNDTDDTETFAQSKR